MDWDINSIPLLVTCPSISWYLCCWSLWYILHTNNFHWAIGTQVKWTWLKSSSFPQPSYFSQYLEGELPKLQHELLSDVLEIFSSRKTSIFSQGSISLLLLSSWWNGDSNIKSFYLSNRILFHRYLCYLKSNGICAKFANFLFRF